MPGTEKLVVERKFDVGGSDELPAFMSISGVDSVGTAADQKLDAVYFDTATLALAARRISLRRRTGGKDAGWHLKLPVGAGERREISEPLNEDPDSVPPRLKGLVLVHTRSQELVAVAHLKTRRTAIPLIAADGTCLAEFSDDRVESHIGGRGPLRGKVALSIKMTKLEPALPLPRWEVRLVQPEQSPKRP